MSFGFQIRGFGFRIQRFGFRIQNFGFRIQGLGFRIRGFGFRIRGFGSRVHPVTCFQIAGFEFEIAGAGVQNSDFRFRVLSFSGFGFNQQRVFGFRCQSFGIWVSSLSVGVWCELSGTGLKRWALRSDFTFGFSDLEFGVLR